MSLNADSKNNSDSNANEENCDSLAATLQEALQQLQEAQQHLHYPSRFFHLQALLKRAQQSQPLLSQLLTSKVQQGLEDYQTLLANKKAPSESSENHSAARTELAQLSQYLNGKNLSTSTALPASSFDGMLQQQEQKALQFGYTEQPQQTIVEQYRDAITQLNTEKFISQVINEVPKDAGPLNAHRLVIKTLTAMQTISPDYLRRMVNQIDTMFYLNAGGK
ncbi:DUF2894 domain-containing protein [Dasania marina]|uniref:DUF2894 domain-containing protein n=1 Tax=Dasania marina TaxID=471499 RepID=UPI00036892AF|nr:DUF2894 domain-containing protein [Dasania marina]